MVMTFLVGSAAAAGDVTCTGGPNNPLTGKIVGNVVVPADASCRIQGTVSGNVTALTGAAVGVRTGSTVRGNYTCNNCLFADLGGSTIGGNVVINGEAEGSFINGSTIKGNLKIDSSSAGPESFSIGTTGGNVIRGNLSFTNNTGPSFIVDNAIAGYLACQNNAPPCCELGHHRQELPGAVRSLTPLA